MLPCGVADIREKMLENKNYSNNQKNIINNKSMIWSSDNNGVATIDRNTGIITSKKAGKATITGQLKILNKTTKPIKVTLYFFGTKKEIKVSNGDSFELIDLFDFNVSDAGTMFDDYKNNIQKKLELVNKFKYKFDTESISIDDLYSETKMATVKVLKLKKDLTITVELENQKVGEIKLLPKNKVKKMTFNSKDKELIFVSEQQINEYGNQRKGYPLSNLKIEPSNADVNIEYSLDDNIEIIDGVVYAKNLSKKTANLKAKDTVSGKTASIKLTIKPLFTVATEIKFKKVEIRPTIEYVTEKQLKENPKIKARGYKLSLDNLTITPSNAKTDIVFYLDDKSKDYAKIVDEDGDGKDDIIYATGKKNTTITLYSEDKISGIKSPGLNINVKQYQTLIEFIEEIHKEGLKAFYQYFHNYVIAHSNGGKTAYDNDMFKNVRNAVLFDAFTFGGGSIDPMEYLGKDENDSKGKKVNAKAAASRMITLFKICKNLDYLLAINTNTNESTASLYGQYFDESLNYMSKHGIPSTVPDSIGVESIKLKESKTINIAGKSATKNVYTVKYKNHTCKIEAIMLKGVGHDDTVTYGQVYANNIVG